MRLRVRCSSNRRRQRPLQWPAGQHPHAKRLSTESSERGQLAKRPSFVKGLGLFQQWPCRDIVLVPPISSTLPDNFRREARALRNLLHGFTGTKRDLLWHGAPIHRLLFHRGPAAITRCIRAIIVGVPVDRMLGRWPAAHVFIKRAEAVSPPLTDRNPSSAIHRVLRVRWIQAALFQGRPCLIFRRVMLPVRRKDFRSAFGRPFPTPAPATLRSTTPQALNAREMDPAAVAPTAPSRRLAVPRCNATQCNEPSEPLASDIYRWTAHIQQFYRNYVSSWPNSFSEVAT